jgi:hypothetical protein
MCSMKHVAGSRSPASKFELKSIQARLNCTGVELLIGILFRSKILSHFSEVVNFKMYTVGHNIFILRYLICDGRMENFFFLW